MKLLRSFPLTAFALVLLGIVGFCAANNNVGLMLVAGAFAAMSWYITEGPRGWALPKWVSNLLILAASINVFFDLAANQHDVIGVLGRFAVWLALIKLYERKTRREYGQLLWLTLVLVVAGAIETRSLLFGIVLFAYTVLGLHGLMLYQLFAAQEAAREVRRNLAPPGARLVPPVRAIFSGNPGVQFGLSVAAIGLVSLAIAVTLFVVLPRGVGMGLFRGVLDQQDDGSGTSGLISQVELLTGNRITDSRSRIMKLQLFDSTGAVIRPSETLYLRGTAYDQYERTTARWIASPLLTRPPIPVDTTPDSMTTLAGNLPGTPTLRADVSPLTNFGDVMYTLGLPATVSTDTERTIEYRRSTQTVTLPGGARLGDYRVGSFSFSERAAWEALADPTRQMFLAPPAVVDPRLTEYAERVLDEAGIVQPARGEGADAYFDFARRASRALEQHFHQRFTYTIDLRDVTITPGEDPVVSFLYEFRRGHCEYFASAMTALCQTLGLEARLVTGFLASEWSDLEQETIVRASDAHAWVEVRVGEYAWARFDPSPPSVVAMRSADEPNLANRVRSLYEIFEGGWLEGIVDFDEASQRDLRSALNLEAFKWVEDVFGAVDQWLGRFSRRFGPAGTFWILLVTLATIVALAIAIQLLRRARRIRRSLHLEHLRGGEYRRMLRQLGFYLDMLDVLRRAKRPKPVWQPPLAYAEALTRHEPLVADAVRDLTATFYRARYGGEALTADELERAESLLSRLAVQLGVRTSRRIRPKPVEATA